MENKNSSKLVVLTFSVLVLCCLTGFYIFAWTGPTAAPPNSNTAAPINIGSEAQTKAGSLTLSSLCLGADCRSSWPVSGTSIPSGMIAMFDTACPVGWTRFTALDDRFPQGSATYGGTGGSINKTTSGHQHNETIGEALPNSPSVPTEVYIPVHKGAPWGLGQTWDGFTQRKNIELKSAATGLNNWQSALTSPNTDSISDIRPPYLNVVWCKKD